MLHKETVYPKTLSLLKGLMTLERLQPFNLAGGTALSLQIGHRISVDLDLFGNHNLGAYRNTRHYFLFLQTSYSSILTLSIDEIKVDFVNYIYPILKPVVKVDEIRLTSIEDIAAMKLAAIAGRGRKRDFYDLYFILRKYKLPEIIDFYKQKYPDGSEFLIVKSLIYFDDAEQDEPPRLIEKLSWERVKKTILNQVDMYYK